MKAKVSREMVYAEKTFTGILKEKIIKLILYLILILGVIATLFPFYYMLVLATKSNTEIFSYPPPVWFGNNFRENLQTLLDALPFFRNILNSVFVATVSTVLTLFFCSLGGMVLLNMNLRARKNYFS